MKKMAVLLLTFCVLISTSVSFSVDYSGVSDDDLIQEFNSIRNELVVRGYIAENKKVLYDDSAFQIYISGEMFLDKEYSWSTTEKLYIPIVIVNNSDQNLTMSLNYVSMNGWSTDGRVSSSGSIPAGKKAKADLLFDLESTDIVTMDDFTDVEFVFHFVDSDTFRTIMDSEAITIVSNH